MNDCKETLQNLSKTQKARMIVAFCICLILNVNAILYVHGIMNYQPAVKQTEGISVDGEDVTPIANMAIAGLNGTFYLLTCVISAVVIGGMGIIMLIPFLCVALRTTAMIPPIELQYTKILIGGMTFLTFIICLIVVQFSKILIAFIFTFIPMLLMLLFYYLPVRLRIHLHEC